jgi:hypothetical protein
MDIIRIILRNTSILYVFDIIKLYSFSNVLSQTLSSLTLTKPRMQGKKDRDSISPTVNLYFLRSILLFANTDVSTTEMQWRI